MPSKRVLAATRAFASIVIFALLPRTSGSHLVDEFDKSISSSFFGEPVFRLEPPNVIHYSSSEGATLLCLASGSPRPTISWFTNPSGYELNEHSSLGANNLQSSGAGDDFQYNRPVTNISNLRLLLQDGAALKLLPFEEADFRREVHAADYRCVASNQVGSIHSKSVTVQAVLPSQQLETLLAGEQLDQRQHQAGQDGGQQTNETQRPRKQLMDFMRVNDEFVQLAAPAVLKCRIQTALANQLLVASDGRRPLAIEWFTSDGFQIMPSELARGHKFLAFETGELHVLDVEMQDLRRTYACRLRNLTSRRLIASSNLAQMILLEAGQASKSSLSYLVQSRAQHGASGATLEAGQVMHSVEQLVALESADEHDEPSVGPAYDLTSYTSHRPPATARAPAATLVLPCAVRLPLDKLARSTRWLYVPPIRPAGEQEQQQQEERTQARPVPIEHLVATHNKWLEVADFRQPQSPATNKSHFEAHSQSRLVIGLTYLAIERARAPLSGRYILQLLTSSHPEAAAKNLCDINVIIRQPIKLRLQPKHAPAGAEQQEANAGYFSEALALGQQLPEAAQKTVGLLEALSSWWSPSGEGVSQRASRERRHLEPVSGFELGQRDEPRNLLERDPLRIRVGGPGAVPQVALARVGQLLELECSGSGHPLDSLRWFRQGQAINTQTAADFQTEIVTTFRPVGLRSSAPAEQQQLEVTATSRLLIRQLQARDAGLLIFECFAQNSLGDRARASQTIFVAERELLEDARNRCPLADGVTNASTNTSANKLFDDQEQRDSLPTSGAELRRLFTQANPMNRALVFEGEPIELECPLATASGLESADGKQTISANRDQLHWFRWTPWAAPADPKRQGQKAAGGAAAANWPATGKGDQFALDTSAMQDQRSLLAGQFNQLFGGDSRFVINGSSLQIRSPSRRHDETLFVCLRQAGARARAPNALHQSSLAGAACLSHLFAAPPPAAPLKQANAGSEQPRVSSISIRIVAKPKIDPFEFSRNLEEGMRTMVVCTVVSGQSLVDINWFKDGELLTAGSNQDQEGESEEGGDEGAIRVQRANEFSSTLTIPKIRPAHSGLYTCIASNALAAAEHTSRLLINVAPYFIEPPRSQRAYLRASVLVNCRAGGQPAPQIRWRKLVPVSTSGPEPSVMAVQSQAALGALNSVRQAKQLAPAGGLGSLTADSLGDYEVSPAAAAPASDGVPSLALKQEFRIITSNSHIQILENGSMIIKEAELADAARYSCQASNGIQPILSETVELQVLQPAQFESKFETLSVKRGATVRFSCVPRGDQPIRLEWSKEGARLLPVEQLSSASSSGSPNQSSYHAYSETIQLAASDSPAPGSKRNATSRSRQLVLTNAPALHKAQTGTSSTIDSGGRGGDAGSSAQSANQDANGEMGAGMAASELLISSAERAHTGLFVCAARNAFGRDDLTYRLLVQEAPDAPINLQIGAVQANSLKLLWQSNFDGNLPISHFVIEHRRLSAPVSQQLDSQSGGPSTSSVVSSAAPADWQRLIVSNEQSATRADGGEPPKQPQPPMVGAASSQPAPLNQALLKHLSAKSTYQIRVAAVNALGQGPFSPIQLVSTAEEAPQARAAELRAQAVSSGAIKLSWRGPLGLSPDEPAPIRGYHVSHRRALGGSSNLNPAGSSSWLATQSVSSSNYSSASPSELMLSATSGARPTLLSYELLLTQLERNTKYEIRVQPFNSMGLGPASELTAQTLPFDRPAQPQLRLVEARKQSLELKWSVGGGWQARAGGQQSQEAELLGFSLYYKCEYDDWQELQLGLVFRYVIENLRCGNKYQIYLSAFNSVGRSEPSEVLLARTDGTAPIAPDKTHFFKLNISEAQLDLGQWSSGGCPISSFMVQFKRLHDTNWFILSEGATPFTQTERVTIPDLTPATWYKLLVTALNEAGSTNAEYVFSTLTLDGQQLEPPSYLVDKHQAGGEPRQPLKAIGSFLSGLSQLFGAGSSSQAQNDNQLLLPLSCVLLLLVTTLAAFLFYSRSSKATQSMARQQQKCRFPPPDGTTINCNGSAPNAHQLHASRSMNQLQLFDRHLLHAHCNGSTLPADSSSSSSSASTQQHHHQNAANTLARQHTMLGMKSELEQSPLNRATNYVLDSFLDQQLGVPTNSSTYSQTSSFVHCPNTGSTALLHEPASLAPLAGKETPANFRVASMKLVPRNADQPVGSLRSAGSYCFADGAGSSSMSSSGLGSVQTSSSGGPNKNLRLIDEKQPEGENFDSVSNYLMSAAHFRPQQSDTPPSQQLFAPALEQTEFGHLQRPQMSQTAEQHFWTQNNYHEPAPLSDQRGLVAASSSFAPAADLASRQQQQQQQLEPQAGEPIYQRLDKFKTCALPACRQFATLNPQFAAKFKQYYLRQQQYAVDDQFLDSQQSAHFVPPPPPLVQSFDYQLAAATVNQNGDHHQQQDIQHDPNSLLADNEEAALCTEDGCLR